MIYIHNIDPILLSIGFIDLYWYGAMYAISFLLLDYLMKKEIYLGNSDFDIVTIDKILLISIFSLLIGGRLGYVIFYNIDYYYLNFHKTFYIWEGGMSFHGALLGILFGILAALCQAIGIILMKPILDEGVDPIASASIRTGVSAIALGITYFLPYTIFKNKTKININLMIKIIISGFTGMALGMSLLLIALQKGDAGIVATLSSTSPIMILFLIWFLTNKMPIFGAWIGSILAIIGAGLIFIN